MFFFFNDTATTEIYTLSLHDALPILTISRGGLLVVILISGPEGPRVFESDPLPKDGTALDVDKSALFESQTQLRLSARVLTVRSEEHTSELQSRQYLVCRLLLEKKNT